MKKVIQNICFITCLISFLFFFLPFILAGIYNIGNITGMIVSLILMFYIKCMPLIHTSIKTLWQKRVGKCICILASSIMILILSLVLIESGYMIHAANKSPTPNATAIVLGCRVYDERPSLSMIERLEAAYTYLTEHPEANCVVSGGRGLGESISEAEAMYRWLTDKGIEHSRIYKEEFSTDTDENIRFSKEIIQRYGLNENITIITSEYHTYRAGLIAEKYDLNYGAAPGQTALWLFPTFYVRELYAILAEWIF